MRFQTSDGTLRAPRSLADGFLESMTVEDMIGQMSQIEIGFLLKPENDTYVLDMDLAEYWIGEMGVGSVLNKPLVPFSAEQYREVAVALNQVAADYNRPPVIWGLDSVFGGNLIHGAVFAPQPINQAATFNKTVAYQSGVMSSRDTRAAGITWTFSPLLGIALEPRWSRVFETFGEDPHLVGEMALNAINGIQAVDESSIPSRAAACAKHFLGYPKPENGHDRSPAWIPTRHLYQYFIPPWKKVSTTVMTAMESYSETDGVPMAANPDALNYLLRQRLHFSGMMVTDYAEMLNLYEWHHVAVNETDAYQRSIRQSTIDMSMIPWRPAEFRQAILEGVDQHLISEERLATSAQRVLNLKEQLNMMEEELTMDDPLLEVVGTNREEALDLVRQSIILAKNEDDTLPLNIDSTPLKVLVTGPTATSLTYQSGGWTTQWQGAPVDEEDIWFTYGTTVLDAFSSDSNFDVSYSCGTSILGADCQDATNTNTTSIALAASAAASSDVVIICVGEENYTEKPGDIRTQHLPAGQLDLVRAIKAQATNAKIILVYFGGRPRLLGDMVEASDAVLIAFLPGPDAGQAIIEIVTGDVNPSGRMPLTYPKYEDTGGIPYFHAVSDLCTNISTPFGPLPSYQYIPCEVQWPFGHGLSYTTFDYSIVSVTGGIDQDLEVEVVVMNTGAVDGSDAILIFTFDESRPVTPEYKLLRAFEKVYLKSGESTTISASIPLEDLKFVGPHDDRHYIIDPTMISWVGVGATTDCRADDRDENPLCVRLSSSNPHQTYVGACEHACELWQDSGCSSVFELTTDSCLDMCTSISMYPNAGMHLNNEGWGWDYVDCLESIVWGNQEMQQMGNDTSWCWEMTAMCRDIFATGQMDEFGVGLMDTGGSLSVGSEVPAGSPNSGDRFRMQNAVGTAIGSTILVMSLMKGLMH